MDEGVEEKGSVIYKQSGGRYAKLNKNDILETMDHTYPGINFTQHFEWSRYEKAW